MKKYVFLILSLCILVNCPAPFHDYVFVKNGKTEKEYTMVLNEISINFSGKYSWRGKGSIYTAISIEINNESADSVIINRKNMIIDSKYFHFKNNTTNKIPTPSMSQKSFWLEYDADAVPSLLANEFTIPKDEILTLRPNGIEIKGKSIKVEEISFIPEENVQAAVE